MSGVGWPEQPPDDRRGQRRIIRVRIIAFGQLVGQLDGFEVPQLLSWLEPGAEYPCGAALTTWLEGLEVSPATDPASIARLLRVLRWQDVTVAEPFHRWWPRQIQQARAGITLLEQLIGRTEVRAVQAVIGQLVHDERRVRPGLIHGDLWFGNMLALDGHLTGVLDWEDSAIGDPACDLAGLGYFGAAWSLGVTDLVGFSDSEVRRARYWQVVRELDGVRWSVRHRDGQELAESLSKLSTAVGEV